MNKIFEVDSLLSLLNKSELLDQETKDIATGLISILLREVLAEKGYFYANGLIKQYPTINE